VSPEGRAHVLGKELHQSCTFGVDWEATWHRLVAAAIREAEREALERAARQLDCSRRKVRGSCDFNPAGGFGGPGADRCSRCRHADEIRSLAHPSPRVSEGGENTP
jgi:hypothetical protein